jgi:hypothetical protein
VNDVFGRLFLMNDGEAEAIQSNEILPIAFFERLRVVERSYLIMQYGYGSVHGKNLRTSSFLKLVIKVEFFYFPFKGFLRVACPSSGRPVVCYG